MRSRVIASVVAVWALALTLSARGPEPPPASKPSTQPAAVVSPQPPSPPTTDDCLTCHEDASSTRANGTSVAVDKGKFTGSVHGGLACVDCHADLAKAELPHADKLAKVDCSSCHDDAAKQYGAGMHARARAGGNDVAATCVSCHGMHDILGSKDPTVAHLSSERRGDVLELPREAGGHRQGAHRRRRCRHAVLGQHSRARPVEKRAAGRADLQRLPRAARRAAEG